MELDNPTNLFSMPQATLESIRRMIDTFSLAKMGVYGEQNLNHAQAQYSRLDICSQLRVVVSPLLTAKTKLLLKEEFKKMKPCVARVGHRDKATEHTFGYSLELEEQLDEFVILVQTELQKLNYFMPLVDRQNHKKP